MRQDEIKALFDRKAANYDVHWSKTAAIRNCLNLLLGSMFGELTMPIFYALGWERAMSLSTLRLENPGWTFTAVEPSGPMLDICRKRTQEEVVASRCVFSRRISFVITGAGEV